MGEETVDTAEEGRREEPPAQPPPSPGTAPSDPPDDTVPAGADYGSPPGMAAPPRNSPWALLGTALLVLAVVATVVLVGRAGGTVGGTPIALPGVAASASPSSSTSAVAAPVRALGTNPLLAADVELPKVACDLPELGRAADQLRAFYTAGVACLDEVWRPALAAVNQPFASPRLDIAADASTECGETPTAEEATAFYCGWDEVIYMPEDRLLDTVGTNPASHLAVLAHEYAHHVQTLSGIMYAVQDELADAEEDGPEVKALTRKVELQANCFAGLFLRSAAGQGSLTMRQAREAVDDFANSGDSDTHGTLANQVRWAEIGFRSFSTGSCNTFTAPEDQVR
ncbi:hypothetical protein SAMN05421810_106163 [Amycolatopsis arida]|uniref:Neutral zinc metallopeptidase n=1 Tax=Amycolatopsis arida TaxID=587909 RepID=A0A1I5XMT6_9PSEU|nr:neutral zinc metallopeptidase [Amycolatopsis arida]TDX97355.1 hypothetical protein CLV69_102458 [Amycolatopsis arida]SFQ33258.1 hypothetical protein SAMN05421810_106163 [Amycolatopsis arida]